MNFKEREVLNHYEDLIRSWGFGFESITSEPEKSGSVDKYRVLLYATPKVEKKAANADDFRDFIQFLSRTGKSYPHSRIRPPVITRLLHSRACRSAIMFGDHLSLGQCRDLIEDLKTCQLPFQCAHGRPSVVPLAEIHNADLK
ncbi:DNA mismatch repair protein Mlh3 [Phytophthora cactorum]|nr:DNA mismatch repair protein Mlh3 [Phytophthora cactorum]